MPARAIFRLSFWENAIKNKWIACALAALAGCGGADIRNADEGTQRPDSEIAIVFTPKEGVYDAKARSARLSAADGKAIGTSMSGFPDATRIAPGTYMFKVRCFDPTLYNPRSNSQLGETFMLFEAKVEAGHFYEIACDVFKAYIVDRGNRFESVKHLLHSDAVQKLRR
jgi:hypothetical protein